MKAKWKNKVIAESKDTKIVEGNHYFPPESVKSNYLKPSDTNTFCPWKGLASYYHLIDGKDELEDGAWYYPEPKPAADEIADHIAFTKNVKIVEE